MRDYIIDKIRTFFRNGAHSELYTTEYKIEERGRFTVRSILPNLFILDDYELVDFYTWLIVNQ